MLKNQRKTDTKKVNYDNYIIDVDAICNSSESTQNQIIVKYLLGRVVSDQRSPIFFNTLIGNKILVDSDQNYIFKPELYSIRYSHLQINPAEVVEQTIELMKEQLKKQILLNLVEIYLNSPQEYNDVPFRILTNTLIHHRILINILDPSHKTNNTFKEMFYDEKESSSNM